VEFAGHVTDAELRDLYANARAFVMPGEEDFGMTAVEALASGCPVIALGRGGALETVPEFGGVFFDDPSEEALLGAVREFEVRESEFRPGELQVWAERFSEAEFVRKMTPFLTGRPPAIRDFPQVRVRR
jgi:glycosyltransferase involved in cell wall biosynthesis